MPKNFFTAHKGNDYQPHLLYPKRAYFYGSFLVGVKMMVTVAILMLPATAFLSEDIFKVKEQEIIKYTNEFRQGNNQGQLQENDGLNRSSLFRAEDMLSNNYFSHVSPQGKAFDTFLREANYDYQRAGENLAMAGYQMREVVEAWKKSPLHLANLQDADFRDIGVGVVGGEVNGQPVTYVVQHLGVQTKDKAKEKGQNLINILNSTVSWREDGDKTLVSAEIETLKKVDSVSLRVFDQEAVLQKAIKQNKYSGEMIIEKPVEELFDVTVLPSVIVKFDGNKIQENNVRWEKPYIPVVGTIEKYISRKGFLEDGKYNVYTIARKIFISFFVLFSAVFFLYLSVVKDKRHRHIVRHTVWFLIICGTLIFI